MHNPHDLTALSELVSRALRHEPERFGLELDDEGWAEADALLAGIRARAGRWARVDRADLERMIVRSAKARQEIDGSRIRARYGHSTATTLAREPAPPPPSLFHGTSPRVAEVILRDGLRPMGRQHVDMSADVDTAAQVGRRKSPTPVILHVDAQAASGAGVSFYRGNDTVWLAERVPAAFIAPCA